MKKVALLLAIICATGISSFSQQLKIGHVNGSELIKHMPDYKIALKDLEGKRDELQTVIEMLSKELDSLQNDYAGKATTWAPVIKEMKEKVIVQKQQNLQEFQQTAQYQIQSDEEAKMNPILLKANMAIEKVAKANGYSYIIDSSAGTMLYVGGEDVTTLVCAELGIPDFTAELKEKEQKLKDQMSGQKPATPQNAPAPAPGMVPKK